MRRSIIISLFGFLTLLTLSLIASSFVFADVQDNRTLAAGATAIISPNSCNSCYAVTNNAAVQSFIPIDTCGFWASFTANASAVNFSKVCCTWYLDADGDTYYPSGGTSVSCAVLGAGWTTTVKSPGDCDDSSGSIYVGVQRTRYQTSYPGCGTACASETQTCQVSGAWDGSYSDVSCTASTRTGYTTATAPCGSSCASYTQAQTCQTNGAWSGTGIGSCAVDPTPTWYVDMDGDNYYPSTVVQCNSPGGWSATSGKTQGDCDDGNGGIYLGVTRTRYSTTTPGCPSCAAVSESQSCQSNNAWSGTYTQTSCTEPTCCGASCYANDGPGFFDCGSVCLWTSPNYGGCGNVGDVAGGLGTQTCNNGVWSGGGGWYEGMDSGCLNSGYC